MDLPHAGDANDDLEYHLERCSLVASISTNATEDDLDGPGRMLGKLYNFAGKHLERGMTKLLPKLRRAGHPCPEVPDHSVHAGEEDSDMEYRFEQCSLASSISTSATADDLPGAGHTIGLFYTSAGRRLELQLGRFAEKLGKGPRMTAFRIQRRRSKIMNLPSGSKKLSKRM